MQTFVNSVERLNSPVYSVPPCRINKFLHSDPNLLTVTSHYTDVIYSSLTYRTAKPRYTMHRTVVTRNDYHRSAS